MSLHVQSQVVGAGERPLTQVTLERTVARVFAEVACEFVRAGELPAAAFPTAVVWLLTYRDTRDRGETTVSLDSDWGKTLGFN